MLKATVGRLCPQLRTQQKGGQPWTPQNRRKHLPKIQNYISNIHINKVNMYTSSTSKTAQPVPRTQEQTDPPEMELYASDVKYHTDSVVPGKGPPPELPTTCCQSGCANCVWIQYAEEVAEYYKDGGAKAREAINNIEDPNLRAFIMLEISDVVK